MLGYAVGVSSCSKMCYKLVVLVLGLSGLLYCSDHAQAEDVTFDPNNIGVCYQVRSKVAYRFYWGTVQRQNANTYSCRTIWNWPTTCTKYWTTYAKVLIPVSETIYYRYVFCCPGYKEVDTTDDGSTPGSDLCVPNCDPGCRNGGQCISPDTCSCPAGWTGPICSQSTQVCSVNNGGCSQGCVDGDNGVATCVCYEGYRLAADKKTCIDVDECDVENGGCAHDCVNQNGSYQCECRPGYILGSDFKSCIDIDECAVDMGGCKWSCSNLNGSFECKCPPGFVLDDNNRTCSDHDECSTGSHNCSQRCMNFQSGFLCACYNGYQLAKDNSTCVDIDECTDGLSGCSQVCTNNKGGFECSCMVGFTLNPDGKTCEDDNECVNENGGCQDICVNSPGSFSCDCREGFSLDIDGTSCTANPCAKLGRPANGNITCTGPQVTDESCSYTCDPGYSLQGSDVRTCLPNGTWSGSETLCVPLECDELIPPDNAVIILPCQQTFLASCVIQCNDGYFIPVGSPSMQQCELTVNGTVEWSPPPTCLPITACDPDPCLHGGRCVVVSPVLPLCDCDGTGYTGPQCQFGVIEVPPFPLLRVGQQPLLLNYTAKPDDELQITLVQDNLTAVTFSPNPAVIVNPGISASIAVTPLFPGLYRVAYILSGTNGLDFDIPQDSYLAISPQIAPPDYTYFINRGVMIGRLLPSCCTPASPIYTSCPSGDDISVLSSCSFSDIGGTLITEGIMFSSGNGLNLPLAIAGARLRFLDDDILVDQLASNERSQTLECSLCGSLAGNLGNVSDVLPGQCDAFAPTVSDIKDFLSSEALAFTYISELRPLIPPWLDLVPVDYPMRGFGLNAYQVDLQREVIVNTIETCSNIPGITAGLHSLLHYSGLLDVTITDLFSNTFTPPASNTPLCFAVNLCKGAMSGFHVGLPQSARLFLNDNLNFFGANFGIAGVSLTRNEPLQIFPARLPLFNQQYWNGRNRFTPMAVDIDIALTGTLKIPYQMNDLTIDLDFSGILAFGVNNFDELISIGLQQRWHGIFSGGYTLDMTFPIYGNTASVSLIPTSTFGVVSFGGPQVSSACSSSSDTNDPAGISFKVRSVPQQGEKDFFTQLLYAPSESVCDLDGFLYLTNNLDMNGFSLNFQCAGIRLGTFVFHELEHTVYFSGNGDFEELCASSPNFTSPPSSVLVQSKFVSNEPVQLGPILLLQPTADSVAFTAVFSRDNSSFLARLYSVNVTLFDATVNTVININEDQLYFNVNNVPLFAAYPINYIGSVEQGKTFGEFPLRLLGTFVRTNASFPTRLEQTVHGYLTTVATSAITRLQNAESAIERARQQVQNIEALLQVRQEDFQTANRLHDQAVINIALANDSVDASLARVEAASEEIQVLKDRVDTICQLQDCPQECMPGLQCKTCYTDVYSTVLGRCPNICYDQKQVRIAPFSEIYTCWVRKQVRVRVRRCVCYRYHCSYRIYYTFVLRTVPEECHRPVFNYEIREEPRLCEKPCPVRVLTGRIAQQCCERNNCSDQVPSSTCLKENAACRVARQQALETLLNAKQNLSVLLSELEEARMRLAIAVSEDIRIRIRVDVTREAVNRTQAVLDSTKEALQLTITQQQELLDMIEDGVMLYRLLQNTSVVNIFSIDSVSFEITIVDKTPFTIPLNIRFSIPGISESFEAMVVFDFNNINLHLQRAAEVLARMAFGNVEDRTKRSRRQTVITEDPDSTTALVNQRCTDLLNTHDYIEELQDTLETIVEQILSSKLNATEAKLENDAFAIIDEEAFVNVNFSVLQTEFNLPIQSSSLLDSLSQGNESKAITAMISSFGEMDEDLANANENSVFLDWQATIEMLHNQTGSTGAYSCFGFADCLTTAVTITRELLELSPISESKQLLSQLPAAADDLLQLALSTNLSIFNALQKTASFRSILNATREMNYWCAQPPNITQHPDSNVRLGENSTLRLTCQATSEFGIEYQWRRNGLFIPGAVDAVLTIDNVQRRHSGNYSCDARNHAGSSQSTNSSVLVRTLPRMFLQPTDAESYAGNENGVVFACNASGIPTPGYRWHFKPTNSNNMSIIDGADNNEYTVFSPQANNSGKYYCEAYNEQGSVFSRGAVLTVLHVSVSQISVRVSLGINKTNDDVFNDDDVLSALQNSVEFGEVDIKQLTLQETSQNQIITVSFLLVTRNTTSNDTSLLSLEELATRTVETRADLLSAEQQLQALADNSTQIRTGVAFSSLELGQLAFVCPDGQALDTTNNLLCVNCPPGNFQTAGERVALVDGVNVTESLPICSACSTNQVQPEQGQTSCISCSGSSNSQQCLVECSSGTFSSTGHQPCSPCPAGTYQPNTGATECFECSSSSPEAFCPVASSEESLFKMGLTPIVISASALIILIIVAVIVVIYCVKRRGKKKKYRMQKKMAHPAAPSQLSLIGVNRINSDKRVIQRSDVYVCMPHNENPDGASPQNDGSLTDSTTPMFEKFMLPDTPPPPPPRSNVPSRSPSLNLPPTSPQSKPPPIPPRPQETEPYVIPNGFTDSSETEAYVIPNGLTSSPVDVKKPPRPPKPVTSNGPNSPPVRPQKPLMLNGPTSPSARPQKPPTSNGPTSPSVQPQKPPMPLPRLKPSTPPHQKPQAKPAVMPRIVRRLSKRYRQHSQLPQVPPESYESFLTDVES